MQTHRKPISTDQPFTLMAVKDRARVSHDDDNYEIQMTAETAALEIEAHCGLALLAQVVTVTFTPEWRTRVALPVGPFLASALPDHPMTLTAFGEGGVQAPITSGWRVEAGRYPVLHLDQAVRGSVLALSYPAGFGMDLGDVPVDLQFAINDHAARMFDVRGGFEDKAAQGLSLAASRIAARHRRVAI